MWWRAATRQMLVGRRDVCCSELHRPNRLWNLATSSSRTTHMSECLSSSRKKDTEAATHPSQQPDNANCSHHVKRHLWQQRAHALNIHYENVKTVAFKAFARAPASPTSLSRRYNVVRARFTFCSCLAATTDTKGHKRAVTHHCTSVVQLLPS